MNNYKINITIEKENELHKILDEIINLKKEEEKLGVLTIREMVTRELRLKLFYNTTKIFFTRKIYFK